MEVAKEVLARHRAGGYEINVACGKDQLEELWERTRLGNISANSAVLGLFRDRERAPMRGDTRRADQGAFLRCWGPDTCQDALRRCSLLTILQLAIEFGISDPDLAQAYARARRSCGARNPELDKFAAEFGYELDFGGPLRL
jgi:hypothetical protein